MLVCLLFEKSFLTVGLNLRKPDFFFDDSIEEDEAALYDGDYKWLRQLGNRMFFLSNMERIYPLVYL